MYIVRGSTGSDFIEAVTRAGSDGEDITKAYLNAVPKGKRNVKDLSELLSDPTIDLTDLVGSSDKLIKEATEIIKTSNEETNGRTRSLYC